MVYLISFTNLIVQNHEIIDIFRYFDVVYFISSIIVLNNEIIDIFRYFEIY